MLYAALIERHLSEQKIVLTDQKRNYTYAQLHEGAMGFLAYLKRRGARRGDRVLVRNHTDGRTIEAILACLAGGMIFVPVSDLSGTKETANRIADCAPSLVLDPSAVHGADTGAGEECGRAKIPESAGAYILYTSGSTGEKKGVFACHKQIIFCCSSILSRLEYHESDKVLCSLPLEFDYGLYQIFLSLWSGARLFLVRTEMMQMIPQYLHRWEITVYPTIASVANALLRLGFWERVRLPHLRCMTFTGEYLSVELLGRLREIFPSVELIPMYGVTECKRVAIMPRGREDKVMAGSCGLPLDGVQVRLFKEKPGDAIGELIVEGPNVMEGYWNEAHGFEKNPQTGMRIYHTGDLLSIDEEGFLYFYGRLNGLLKVRGKRISEAEIENIVKTVDGVVECAVLGIADSLYGEKIGVCVTVRNETTGQEIRKVLAERPEYVNLYELFLFSGLLPRNPHGKIDKRRLREIIDEKRPCFLRK